MTTGLAVLTPLAIGWSRAEPREHRVECKVDGAPRKRPLAIGVRVEERAIWQHVERARAGEAEAVAELFLAFHPQLLRFCQRMVGLIEAEDAATESFQRAQHRLESYDTTQPFRRWLFSIAAHLCIDRLRRRSLEKHIFAPGETDLDEHVGHGGTALDELVQSRRQVAVRDALDRLPDRYRAPLVLRYFAELDYDAIGEELDLSRSQVASSLFRAKQQLRSLLHNERETDS